MAIDRSQKSNDATGTLHQDEEHLKGEDGQRGTHNSTEVPEVEKEHTKAKESEEDDNAPRTSSSDTEQVETLDAGGKSESTFRGGKRQESQSENGKNDSAASISSDDVEPTKVEDASKNGDATLDAPQNGTPPRSGEAEQPGEKNFGFVEEICSKVCAIQLLDKVIRDPYSEEHRKNFSEAVDRQILERQHHIGNTDNLLLPMRRVSSLVVQHAKAHQKSTRFESYAKKEQSKNLRESYGKKIQIFEKEMHSLEDEWKALLGAKGYPEAWTTKLEASDDKIKIDWKGQGPSGNVFTEELREQKALACQIWGVSEIDKVERPEYLSWSSKGHQIQDQDDRRRNDSE
jgi:hypothetical protein